MPENPCDDMEQNAKAKSPKARFVGASVDPTEARKLS
jgi:hypothetical protein